MGRLDPKVGLILRPPPPNALSICKRGVGTSALVGLKD